MIVLDSNVLLSAYRFTPTARRELLSTIRNAVDRIWIPFRVAEEFHKNRISVIIGYDSEYNPVIRALREAQASIDRDLFPRVDQLANRAAMTNGERQGLKRLVAESTAAACGALEELRKQHDLSVSEEDDAILAEYQELFEAKTGLPFDEAGFAAAVAEAERRSEQNIPPGYLDSKKPEPYGDYVIWKQTLIEARDRKCSYLLFVTGDTKEDWYQIVKGRTIGARPELVREARNECGAQLVMCDTSSFLFHARQYLHAEVSQETIRQSEAMAARNALEIQWELGSRRQRLASLVELERITQMRLDKRFADVEKIEIALGNKRLSDGDVDDPAGLQELENAAEASRRSVVVIRADLADVRERRIQFETELASYIQRHAIIENSQDGSN